jgi:hypothetical protein
MAVPTPHCGTFRNRSARKEIASVPHDKVKTMANSDPNLFIVGAAKAGTSALRRALSEHPEIYFSETKEPNYFGQDLLFRQPRISRHGYIELFEAGRDARYRGEASVLYLYSNLAPIEILQSSPKARIIIMLRDPIDLVYSAFWQNLKTGLESASRFERALKLEPSRRKGRNIPRSAHVVNGLFYSELARAPEAAHYFENIFGAQSVFVGDLEDLERNPQEFYRRLFRFLDLPPVMLRTIVANRGAQPRSVFFAKLAQRRTSALIGFGRRLLPRQMRRPILNLLRSVDHRYNRRSGYPPMRLETRRWLESKYAAQRRAYHMICTEHRRRWKAESSNPN